MAVDWLAAAEAEDMQRAEGVEGDRRSSIV